MGGGNAAFADLIGMLPFFFFLGFSDMWIVFFLGLSPGLLSLYVLSASVHGSDAGSSGVSGHPAVDVTAESAVGWAWKKKPRGTRKNGGALGRFRAILHTTLGKGKGGGRKHNIKDCPM